MKKRLLITASLLLPAMMSMGAGYQLNLQGLRQLAMGGGGCAWVWDASTIFYNPAGMSQMKGIQAYASGLMIIPNVEYVKPVSQGGGTAQSKQQTFTPFNVYIGGAVTKSKKLGVGLGVYTPFGSGLKWDENWAGRYINQSIYLQSIFFQPTVSYRISDIVSIGGGFIYAIGKVDLKQALPTQDASGADGQAELKGNAHGTGYNLGIHLKANDNLQFGVTYRSQVKMKVTSGDATFNVPSSLSGEFPAGTTFSTSLPLPEVLSVGVGYRICKHLTLTADFNLVGWKAYDTLRFDYSNNTPLLQNTRTPRLYKNTLACRLGANYRVVKGFNLMAGVAYDPSPVRDGYVSPELPDANRLVLTGGLTIKPAKNLTIMAAVEYVRSQKRDSEFAPANFYGTYQTKAITPGIGLSYDF
ncbi:OmpP1/FadL family transporter [Chitinophagaceae bacterium MMS25-I14]